MFKMQISLCVLCFLLLMLLIPAPANAGYIFTFGKITEDGRIVQGVLSEQLAMEVFGPGDPALESLYGGEIGPGQALFVFTNAIGTDSSITDIYFDDGTLLGIAAIRSSSGVSYSIAATPAELPGGGNLTPPFVTGSENSSETFSADSDPSVAKNGVNSADEWVAILFNLINGKTSDDVISALNAGDLRVGLKVQSIGPLDISESYVNTPVPEPSLILLLGIGMGAVCLTFHHFKK